MNRIYCFIKCDRYKNNVTLSNGYFNGLRELPTFFRYEDIHKTGRLSKTQAERLPKMRNGSKIKYSYLHSTADLYILCLDEESELYQNHLKLNQLKERKKQILDALKNISEYQEYLDINKTIKKTKQDVDSAFEDFSV